MVLMIFLPAFFSVKDASEVEEEAAEQKKLPAAKPNTQTKPEKRKRIEEKTVKAKKKKKNEQV